MEKTILTSTGWVRGRTQDDGSFGFLGIPFAQARRFMAPEPVTWEGVRDCFEYAPLVPHPNYRGVKRPEHVYAMLGSEEGCLALNVWTRHPEAGAKRPVVVMVHGGAFQVGSSRMDEKRRSNMAGGRDVVFISVTYRVGVLGFLELGDMYGGAYRGSGNNGSRDLLMALEWIYRNAEAFGGDPDNVTVMAISAGAKNMGCLLTLPRLQTLCHKVVLESGAMQAFRTVQTALHIRDQYLERLPEGTDLLTAPAEKLVEVQAEFCSGPGNTCFFGPVLEAPFDPDWEEKWLAGQHFTGSAILGGGLHELCFTTHRPGYLEHAREIAREMFGDQAPLACRMAEEQTAATGDALAAWTAVMSDFMYRFYTTALAKRMEADGCRVWSYSMDVPPAGHGQGFAFLEGNVEPPGQHFPEEQLRQCKAVGAYFSARIGEFIEDGQPDPALWPEYQGGHKLVLDFAPHAQYRPQDTLTGFPPRAIEYM